MSTSSPTQSAMYHGVDFWKIVAWVGLCWRVRSIWSTLELLSSSVLPICFVAADSDAPAPAAIEISASVAYRPTSPKILKLSRGVRQAGHVRDQLARRSRKAAGLDRHQRRRLLLGCSQATSHSERGRSRHTHLARFAEIWIASLAPTFLVGYQLASRRRTASQVLGARRSPLRRRSPAAGPSPRGPAAPPQGRWATALDRMGMGHLSRRVWEGQSLSIRRMEI